MLTESLRRHKMDREIDMFSVPEDEGTEVDGSESIKQPEQLSEDAKEVDRLSERMEIKKLLMNQRSKNRKVPWPAGS